MAGTLDRSFAPALAIADEVGEAPCVRIRRDLGFVHSPTMESWSIVPSLSTTSNEAPGRMFHFCARSCGCSSDPPSVGLFAELQIDERFG